MNKDQALKALDVKLGPNDCDAETVRQYFKELLYELLYREESFSGKRPFGNSGWRYEFLEPLHEAGFCSERPDDQELEVLFDSLVGAL